MEKKISQKEFDDIVEKYKNDETLWEEFRKNPEQVKKDIYNACKFNLTKFGKMFPQGSYYYMEFMDNFDIVL
ncbi:MAG: hypothetical protein J1F05_02450 [Muribaculaceae bacterium]|nr:hypothetical protein [Muribaculaceae bacterium]